ncbi:methyltransferase domain-containing protein [Pseudoalteromonas apostichopi]|uniref:methyltransferase domain-containing protein n=1 Tax=Pseudoalteromonas apostichopi TaxID=3035452 RepID=UPI0025748349|nr:methyltransferase domain-containing protein [Pseudoalteromonas sp. FE4]
MIVQLQAATNCQSNKLTTQTKFSRAAANYASHANVQKQAATHLFKMMANKHQQGTCLDLGAGPLVNTAMLKTHFDTVLAMDLSHSMLSTEQSPRCLKVCADMDNLPLQQNTLDCVFSNFAMQWSADFKELLKNLFCSLKIGGKVYLSCVVDGSLKEIKQAFSCIDQQSHINQFHCANKVIEYAKSAGFKLNFAADRCYIDTYNSPLEALRSIKAIGATSLQTKQKRQGLLTRHALNSVCKTYPLVDGHARVSYQVVLLELEK